MIHPDAHGQGLGRQLAIHSLEVAKEMGFEAMQFNFVISTNHGAIHLWKSLGFEIVGTLPKVYRHATLGLVDVHVMHRYL
jgi:ribosomal protein S18 acetylase RimI-like enzyme